MNIKTITISGLRGFADPQMLPLAIPNGKAGSGLTILVGPNNGGKSTIVEAFRALSKSSAPSFPIGKRNKLAGAQINIVIENLAGGTKGLKTVSGGGSETEWVESNVEPLSERIFVLPSRRFFDPYFKKDSLSREKFTSGIGLPPARGQAIQRFSARLFEIQNNRGNYNKVLEKVLDPIPEWVIEQADTGQYYLNFRFGQAEHSSDGLGDGLVSLLLIVDALYDSQPDDVIVIDEPELSLHPALQKRLNTLLAEYATHRQIVISTHSPYFVDFNTLLNGARIARVQTKSSRIVIHPITDSSIRNLQGLLKNRNNPHILGLVAKEVFFLEDRVILVEGQDDVVFYKEILSQLQKDISGDFYGWGVGGAGNMDAIAFMLRDLGFEKVAGVLDKNEEQRLGGLTADFPEYRFFVIPVDDVRTRSDREGLLDEEYQLRPKYYAEISEIINNINNFFGDIPLI